MPGSATLDPDVLVDSLVTDVIDGLRSDLHPAFGVRAYRVYTIRETWSGSRLGEGNRSEVATEITPQPLVEAWDGLRYELARCGLDEMGQVRLREVSLTYTEAELIGPSSLGKNERWLIRIDEAHGQENTSRYFVHTKPPYVDREKDMGWIVWLRASEVGG